MPHSFEDFAYDQAYLCTLPDYFNLTAVLLADNLDPKRPGYYAYLIPELSELSVPEWARNEGWIDWDTKTIIIKSLPKETVVENEKPISFSYEAHVIPNPYLSHERYLSEALRTNGRVYAVTFHIDGYSHFVNVISKN